MADETFPRLDLNVFLDHCACVREIVKSMALMKAEIEELKKTVGTNNRHTLQCLDQLRSTIERYAKRLREQRQSAHLFGESKEADIP